MLTMPPIKGQHAASPEQSGPPGPVPVAAHVVSMNPPVKLGTWHIAGWIENLVAHWASVSPDAPTTQATTSLEPIGCAAVKGQMAAYPSRAVPQTRAIWKF